MYDYEVTPPQGVWEAIEAELDQGGKVITMKVEKRSLSFFYSMAAAAVTLILFVSIAFSIQQGADSNDKMNATSQGAFNSATRSYVVMCTKEGQEVTVSKKVAPMVISENEPAQKNPRRPEWSKKMKKWQNKMMTASTTNFLDVMDIAIND